MDEMKLAEKVGTLLKNLPQKHSREYSQGLTLDENSIIQKLISEDVLTAKIKFYWMRKIFTILLNFFPNTFLIWPIWNGRKLKLI